MFDLWMLMAHKQCYVAVMLNKRRYTNDIGVFGMFTVILANAFDFFQDHDTTRRSCGKYLIKYGISTELFRIKFKIFDIQNPSVSYGSSVRFTR